MRVVRFIKNNLPYGVGETAGFPDDQAEALVGSGVAILVAPKTSMPEPVPVVEVIAEVIGTPEDKMLSGPARRAGSPRRG